MHIPLIEQAKIQAKVLLPVIRALRLELGEARADNLMRKALGELFRQYGKAWWKSQGDKESEEKIAASFNTFAEGDALDYEVLAKTTDSFELNVTGCQYAKFYQAIGAADLGFLLTCSSDFPFAEGFGNEVKLSRTQTIMQGADHCDFRYELRRKKLEGDRD